MKFQLIKIEKLKPHEHVSKRRVTEVSQMIKKAEKFTEPILVEKNTLVILDGHHRVQAMKKMGYKKIPAKLVDYTDVKVSLRRKDFPSAVIKEFVLFLSSKNIILPKKSTKHEMIS